MTILLGLYGITDPELLPGDRLVPAVEAAIRGGMKLVQYRDKKSSEIERLRNARRLAQCCREAGATLIINDDPGLCQRVGASGVHLGQQDSDIGVARKQLGPEFIIGATCHGYLSLAAAADLAGADYLAFGRFFPSRTKSSAPPADIKVLHEASAKFRKPLVAIGGVTLDNAPQLIAHGASMVAVVHSLFASKDIEATARAFTALFEIP